MPSMRPQPTPAPAAPVQRKPGDVRKTIDVRKQPVPPPMRDASEADEEEVDGGFHESSYELRTGVDIIESDWPDDVTIPGGLDDDR
jgi:hypothetical protein